MEKTPDKSQRVPVNLDVLDKEGDVREFFNYIYNRLTDKARQLRTEPKAARLHKQHLLFAANIAREILALLPKDFHLIIDRDTKDELYHQMDSAVRAGMSTKLPNQAIDRNASAAMSIAMYLLQLSARQSNNDNNSSLRVYEIHKMTAENIDGLGI